MKCTSTELTKLMRKKTDSYGNIQISKVLEELNRKKFDAFDAFWNLYYDPQNPEWRMPAVEGMRSLAFLAQLGEGHATQLVDVTEEMARLLGDEEYYKTIRVLGFGRYNKALLELANRRFQKRDVKDPVWLGFYAISALLEDTEATIPPKLLELLEQQAKDEPDEARSRQYNKVISLARSRNDKLDLSCALGKSSNATVESAAIAPPALVADINAKEKVLVIDDDRATVESLKLNLEKEGYVVIAAYDGIEAVSLATDERPDLIILDIMLPGQGGLEVCRQIREIMKTPILMATAKGEEIDKILGLELGAEYVTKPFSPSELIARAKAILRRTSIRPEEQEEISVKDITMNLVKHEVQVKGQRVDLKPKEFELLKLLATNKGKVFTRDSLLEQLWGYDYLGDRHTIDVHVRRIRQKIEEDASLPKYLRTVRGTGYIFQCEEEP